jgi:hypothetical protein
VGAISPEAATAGRAFRDNFEMAYPALRRGVTDPAGVGGASRREPNIIGNDVARDRVWGAIGKLGGMASVRGNCAWHVVGLGQATKEWGRVLRWNFRSVADPRAVLIETLRALAV